MSKKAKVLFFDTELTPHLAYVWDHWETNVLRYKERGRILSFSYKWLGEKKIHFVAAKTNDKNATKRLWNLFNEANVLVAHNGDRFDIKRVYARFAYYDLGEPSPFTSVDTLKIARRHFAFPSNKLDELGRYLGLGKKVKHSGKDLWFDCMDGDPKAWAKMKRYNEQDVRLLEKVYHRFEPHIKNHPNLTLIAGGNKEDCPRCGSDNLRKDGIRYTAKSAFQSWECGECGKKFQHGSAA